MVAAINTTAGKSHFASFREPAWHGLGTVFTEEVTDYGVMLAKAGLANWNVRFETLATESGLILDTHQATVRTNPVNGETDILGVTGNRYNIIQNEDAFAFLQSLADGARWETAGALGHGNKVFGSIAFDRETVLDPNGVADKVRTYALVHTSHDGSTGMGYGLTPVRVVCQNTLNIALGNLSQSGKIRHTASADDRMAARAELFRTANSYFDAFDIEARELFEKPVTDKQYSNLITKKVFPKSEDTDKNVKGALTKWENKVELFMEAWNGEPNAGIKGTAWGAFNALTEANQWGRKIQNTENGEENFYAAGSGFDIPTNAFRAKALTLVKAIR